jgi:hypothetical protein
MLKRLWVKLGKNNEHYFISYLNELYMIKNKTYKAFTYSRQFTCPFCNKGFNQRSRLQRQKETAHPPNASSTADLERTLKGIKYPKTKEEIIEIVSQKTSTLSPEVLNLISSLPKRSYPDSAEVAKALGEIKSGKRPRSSSSIAKSEPPSKKGGRSALKSRKISASGIAVALKGINFPNSKRGIMRHVRKQQHSIKEEIISILHRISDKKYQNLVQVENEVGRIK